MLIPSILPTNGHPPPLSCRSNGCPYQSRGKWVTCCTPRLRATTTTTAARAARHKSWQGTTKPKPPAPVHAAAAVTAQDKDTPKRTIPTMDRTDRVDSTATGSFCSTFGCSIRSTCSFTGRTSLTGRLAVSERKGSQAALSMMKRSSGIEAKKTEERLRYGRRLQVEEVKRYVKVLTSGFWWAGEVDQLA